MSDEPGAGARERIFIIFKQAIEDERQAQVTYAEALGITEDPILRDLFRTLLADERRHEEVLLRRCAEFKAKLGL
jgi:rubrerythrin